MEQHLLYGDHQQPAAAMLDICDNGDGIIMERHALYTTETTAGNILDLKYGFNFGSSDNGNVMGITNNRDSTRFSDVHYDSLNRIATAAASTYAISAVALLGGILHD